MMFDIMSISFKIGEIEFTVSTAAEAASVVREFSADEIKSKLGKSNGAERPSWSASSESIEPEIVSRSIRFLNKIKDAPRTGAESKAVMEALQVEHPKGVGAKSVGINKLLIRLGFNKNAVYRTHKRPNHARTWRAGPSINTAISALREELSKALSEKEALRLQGPS